MSWAHGMIKLRDGSEIEAGYSVVSDCHLDGCDKVIDRGLAYRCGGCDFDEGCGHYFCTAHLYLSLDQRRQQLCPLCDAAEAEDDLT